MIKLQLAHTYYELKINELTTHCNKKKYLIKYFKNIFKSVMFVLEYLIAKNINLLINFI